MGDLPVSKAKYSPGLYRVWWKKDAKNTSLVSIGCREDGSNWMAPTNWLLPTSRPEDFEAIEKIVKLDLMN